MSVIYIINHDEVIYDAVKSRTPASKPPPSELPHFDLNFVDPGVKYVRKYGYATMGPPDYSPPDPKNFLRKHSKTKPPRKKSEKFVRDCVKNEKLTPLPKPIEIPRRKEKNFIKVNYIEAKKKKPVEPKKQEVFTRTGDKRELNYALKPKYVLAKNFGKAPQYLLKRISHTKQVIEAISDKEALKKVTNCRYITRPEREALLNGLKENWEEMQMEFQLLPMITDTIPKMLRKTKLENDLAKLEKDIVLIEKHPYLYVLDED